MYLCDPVATSKQKSNTCNGGGLRFLKYFSTEKEKTILEIWPLPIGIFEIIFQFVRLIFLKISWCKRGTENQIKYLNKLPKGKKICRFQI